MKKAGATIVPPPAKGEIERGSLWLCFKAQEPNPTPTLPLKKGEEKIDSSLCKKEGENLLLPCKKGKKNHSSPFQGGGWRRSGSAVAILKSHYIILAQIGTGLHLNQLQRYLARIFQGMDLPYRQIDRLVLGH